MVGTTELYNQPSSLSKEALALFTRGNQAKRITNVLPMMDFALVRHYLSQSPLLVLFL